jgi:glutamate/tyrosine decarboxylase-like PLP-dependent enzyme
VTPPEGDPQDPTLDPEDWSEVRRLGHELLDDLIDGLSSVSEGPAWAPMPDEVKARLREPAARPPADLSDVLDDLRRDILPYSTGNRHPRWFGWVHGTGTVEGALAELVAAFMNCNVGGREHAAVYVERQVVRWLADLFGFPQGSSGLLVSGTSVATIVGLAVARESVAPGEVRSGGVAAAPGPLITYAADGAHVSIRKALELLGLGSNSLRQVPADPVSGLDPGALQGMIDADRAAGLHPFCIVGTAGSVTTGAIDDLAGVADVAARNGLWFHVDAAFGGALALSPLLRTRLAGIERADSLAFDLHKWLHVPYDAGCVLVRDAEAHRATFSADRNYLSRFERGTGAGDPWFTDFGPELSRGFRALKVWVTLRTHGLDRLGKMVEKNCEQAAWLAGRLSERDGWELAAPTSLNIVCFRAEAPPGSAVDEDSLNREIVMRVQESGAAVPSTAEIDGRLCIRVAITNHRTRCEDLELFLRAIEDLRIEILAEEES